MLVRRGDDVIVVGSNGGNPQTPNWYRNLLAAGGGKVQVGADAWEVTARELPEGDERAECWHLANAAYPDFGTYQELTDRRIPVAVLERA
jgi:deazaflavin-dependent oxidoreductase (nitroreductase family)